MSVWKTAAGWCGGNLAILGLAAGVVTWAGPQVDAGQTSLVACRGNGPGPGGPDTTCGPTGLCAVKGGGLGNCLLDPIYPSQPTGDQVCICK